MKSRWKERSQGKEKSEESDENGVEEDDKKVE